MVKIRDAGKGEYRTTMQKSNFDEKQDKRPIAVDGYPKAPFSVAFIVLMGGVSAISIPFHAQLVLSSTGSHFTYIKWMES